MRATHAPADTPLTRSLRRTVLAAAVAILLVQGLATGLMVERGRQEAVAQANQTVDRIARAVEANINRHFTQVESLLFGLPVILGPARDGRFDATRASEVLQELNNQNLIYRDILLLDSTGQAVATACRCRPAPASTSRACMRGACASAGRSATRPHASGVSSSPIP